MKLSELHSAAQIVEILTDAAEIDLHVEHLLARVAPAGNPVPLRPLGIWEEMRLDQRQMILNAQV